MEWNFLPFRFWIGMWITLILIVAVMTDASALVCFITRFTEENFATLIAVIFIKQAFVKLWNIGIQFPLHESACECQPSEDFMDINSTTDFIPLDMNDKGHYQCNVIFCLIPNF